MFRVRASLFGLGRASLEALDRNGCFLTRNTANFPQIERSGGFLLRLYALGPYQNQALFLTLPASNVRLMPEADSLSAAKT